MASIAATAIFALSTKPSVAQAAARSFDEVYSRARSIAATSGDGATIFFAPEASQPQQGQFVYAIAVYKGRPDGQATFGATSSVPILHTNVEIQASGFSNAAFGRGDAFAVFVSSNGDLRWVDNYRATSAALANEPTCDSPSLVLMFMTPGQTTQQRTLRCGGSVVAEVLPGPAAPSSAPTPVVQIRNATPPPVPAPLGPSQAPTMPPTPTPTPIPPLIPGAAGVTAATVTSLTFNSSPPSGGSGLGYYVTYSISCGNVAYSCTVGGLMAATRYVITPTYHDSVGDTVAGTPFAGVTSPVSLPGPGSTTTAPTLIEQVIWTQSDGGCDESFQGINAWPSYTVTTAGAIQQADMSGGSWSITGGQYTYTFDPGDGSGPHGVIIPYVVQFYAGPQQAWNSSWTTTPNKGNLFLDVAGPEIALGGSSLNFGNYPNVFGTNPYSPSAFAGYSPDTPIILELLGIEEIETGEPGGACGGGGV